MHPGGWRIYTSLRHCHIPKSARLPAVPHTQGSCMSSPCSPGRPKLCASPIGAFPLCIPQAGTSKFKRIYPDQNLSGSRHAQSRILSIPFHAIHPHKAHMCIPSKHPHKHNTSKPRPATIAGIPTSPDPVHCWNRQIQRKPENAAKIMRAGQGLAPPPSGDGWPSPALVRNTKPCMLLVQAFLSWLIGNLSASWGRGVAIQKAPLLRHFICLQNPGWPFAPGSCCVHPFLNTLDQNTCRQTTKFLQSPLLHTVCP